MGHGTLEIIFKKKNNSSNFKLIFKSNQIKTKQNKIIECSHEEKFNIFKTE